MKFVLLLSLMTSSLFANDHVLKMESSSFAKIPAGVFNMGSPEGSLGYDENEHLHEVKISKSFEIMKTEVSQLFYFLVMQENPSFFKKKIDCPKSFLSIPDKKTKKTISLCPSLPVETVSPSDIDLFIKKLSKITKRSYSLPTEAQWEYAARAGSDEPFYFGSSIQELKNHAIFVENSIDEDHPRGQPQNVGPFRDHANSPNSFGLYDMYGNVWEWCLDWYAERAEGHIDPQGPLEGTRKVIRGGSFGNVWQWLRSAARYSYPPSKPNEYVGFRLIRI